MPCEASLSICGVVPGSRQPNAPTESQFISSTVMMRIFGRLAAVAVDTRSRSTKSNGSFLTVFSFGGSGRFQF
jgi:hypothetical protein